jgi:predicted glycoside hydrolase/deacetylase ChbG (UPF0249 family)
MAETRRLIVNADDFGQSAGVNLGIIEAFERGIVTSTSIMVRWPAAADAAQYARSHSQLSVGLHFEIGEWVFRQGEWIPLYEVVAKTDGDAVSGELSRQLQVFGDLLGRAPSHLDSHQHVHRSDPIRSIMIAKAQELGIPLRLDSKVRFCGSFYGQTEHGAPLWDQITVASLDRLLSALEPGTTELGCHPASFVDFETMYAMERLRELEVLCDSRLRRLLADKNIELCSFNNLPGHP